jgi:hypothetical protein
VANEQFRQLLSWAQRPHVEIQVLPFDAGLHSGMSGAFTVLSFPDGLLPDTGWQEYALGGHIIDDPSDVASLTTLYEELRGQALGCDESLSLLAEFVENTH